MKNLPKKTKKLEIDHSARDLLLNLGPHIALFSDLMDTYDIYLLFKLNDADFANFYTNNCLEIRRICCDFIKQNRKISSSDTAAEQIHHALDYSYNISRAMDTCVQMAKPLDTEVRKFYIQIINLHLYRASEALHQFFKEVGINVKDN